MPSDYQRSYDKKPADFHVGFELEPHIVPAAVQSCPPPPLPENTKVVAESVKNFFTLTPSTINHNDRNGYGMTGLMAVQRFENPCYGVVLPGFVFLFPGTYEEDPEPYEGTVHINCQEHAPLVGSGNPLPLPLHRQMCDLLRQPSTNFIGFSCKLHFAVIRGTGFNSRTCNPHWFNGETIISKDCNGTNWQRLILDALFSSLDE